MKQCYVHTHTCRNLAKVLAEVDSHLFLITMLAEFCRRLNISQLNLPLVVNWTTVPGYPELRGQNSDTSQEKQAVK